MDSLNPDHLPAPGPPPAGALPTLPKVPHESSARGRPTVRLPVRTWSLQGDSSPPSPPEDFSHLLPPPHAMYPSPRGATPFQAHPPPDKHSLACSSCIFGLPSPSMSILSCALLASTTFSYANTNPKKEKSWGGQGLEGDSEDRTREVAIWEGLRSASLALRVEEGAIH